jgi:hypothetical protein
MHLLQKNGHGPVQARFEPAAVLSHMRRIVLNMITQIETLKRRG